MTQTCSREAVFGAAHGDVPMESLYGRHWIGTSVVQKCNRRLANAGRREISVYTWQTSLPNVHLVARTWSIMGSTGEHMHFAYVDRVVTEDLIRGKKIAAPPGGR